MSVDLASQLMAQMIWTSVLVSIPVLGTALLVGLLVSIFQVITQIQEMSLSFIPKLAATVGIVILMGPWMLKRIMSFASTLYLNIPNYV